jgi:hypothetical protein
MSHGALVHELALAYKTLQSEGRDEQVAEDVEA